VRRTQDANPSARWIAESARVIQHDREECTFERTPKVRHDAATRTRIVPRRFIQHRDAPAGQNATPQTAR